MIKIQLLNSYKAWFSHTNIQHIQSNLDIMNQNGPTNLLRLMRVFKLQEVFKEMVHGFTSSYRIKNPDFSDRDNEIPLYIYIYIYIYLYTYDLDTISIWCGHGINMIDDPLWCLKDVIQINNAKKYMKVLNVIIQ